MGHKGCQDRQKPIDRHVGPVWSANSQHFCPQRPPSASPNTRIHTTPFPLLEPEVETRTPSRSRRKIETGTSIFSVHIWIVQPDIAPEDPNADQPRVGAGTIILGVEMAESWSLNVRLSLSNADFCCFWPFVGPNLFLEAPESRILKIELRVLDQFRLPWAPGTGCLIYLGSQRPGPLLAYTGPVWQRKAASDGHRPRGQTPSTPESCATEIRSPRCPLVAPGLAGGTEPRPFLVGCRMPNRTVPHTRPGTGRHDRRIPVPVEAHAPPSGSTGSRRRSRIQQKVRRGPSNADSVPSSLLARVLRNCVLRPPPSP